MNATGGGVAGRWLLSDWWFSEEKRLLKIVQEGLIKPRCHLWSQLAKVGREIRHKALIAQDSQSEQVSSNLHSHMWIKVIAPVSEMWHLLGEVVFPIWMCSCVDPTEAHKSAFKLCSFESKCHPHTKTLASGGDLGVGLWQLRGSPWEPARFNHRARETQRVLLHGMEAPFGSDHGAVELIGTKVKTETRFYLFCNFEMQQCHCDARHWYAVAKVFHTAIAFYFQILLL